MTCSGVNLVQLYSPHHVGPLSELLCVCAKKISPSGRLTYWGLLNTWSHPSKMSNKRSLIRLYSYCTRGQYAHGWPCIVLWHTSLICRCRCYFLWPLPGMTAWTEEHVALNLARMCQDQATHLLHASICCTSVSCYSMCVVAWWNPSYDVSKSKKKKKNVPKLICHSVVSISNTSKVLAF